MNKPVIGIAMWRANGYFWWKATTVLMGLPFTTTVSHSKDEWVARNGVNELILAAKRSGFEPELDYHL